jgi:cytochrome c553
MCRWAASTPAGSSRRPAALMHNIVDGLTDEDILNLPAYAASLAP